MAEKKIHENPIQETQPEQTEKQKEMIPKTQEKASETTVSVPVATGQGVSPQRRFREMLTISKTPPNDLYRRLLPAVLFVMTFVTVMAMLLSYMANVALEAQQFHLNMSRDYELRRIEQDEPSLVAYVRQLHLAPPAPPAAAEPAPAPPPPPPPEVAVLDDVFGKDHVGRFVEMFPAGARARSARFVEAARGWGGVVARAEPRAFLQLRPPRAARLHACLSRTDHPREVTYQAGAEAAGSEAARWFRSRVLCLPLYTVLLAAAPGSASASASASLRLELVVLAGAEALPALRTLPFERLHLTVLEIHAVNETERDKTRDFLVTKNYTAKAEFGNTVMYILNSDNKISVPENGTVSPETGSD